MIEEQNPYTRKPLFSSKINVIAVGNWIRKYNKRRREKKNDKYEWYYEGCDCSPLKGYLGDPYCPIHGTPLKRRRIKKITESELYAEMEKR